MSSNEWSAKSITVSDNGQLVIDAVPSYDNRKKWTGEMVFYVGEAALKMLEGQLADRKTKESLIEIAQAEMKEYLGDLKKEYLKHRKVLAGKLDIDEADVPTPSWYSFDDPDVDIDF